MKIKANRNDAMKIMNVGNGINPAILVEPTEIEFP